MKKTFTFMLAAMMVCAFAFVGCQKNTPRAYVDKFYTALKKKDYATVVDMMPDTKELSKEDKEGAIEMMKLFDGFAGGVKDYEIVSEEISEDGKRATVTVKVTYGTGDVQESEEKFVKTKKGWQPAALDDLEYDALEEMDGEFEPFDEEDIDEISGATTEEDSMEVE